MNLDDATNFLEKHFRRSTFNDQTISNIETATFIDVLNVIENALPFVSAHRNATACCFLWAGCKKFDRWFVPTPYVVPDNYAALQERFALALLKAEGSTNENGAVFLVHSIRNAAYKSFNNRPLPLDENGNNEIDNLKNALAKLNPPAGPNKLPEFKSEREFIVDLLDAIQACNLITHCEFTVPYPLVKNVFSFDLTWQGISIEGRLIPTFTAPNGQLIQVAPPNVLVPKTATRWQFGTTKIELSFKALIDPSAKVAPLQLPMEPMSPDGWPNIFRTAFQILYEVCWLLQQRNEFIGIWTPSPADLGSIEYWIETAKIPRCCDIHKSNPAFTGTAFTPSTEGNEKIVHFGALSPTPWHIKCRILAEQYLELGDTRESLFWLNVGVESLLNERMSSLVTEAGISINMNDVTGAPSYWDNAKELLAQNFPNIVEQIKWPEIVPHVSMFRRLKFFTKNVKLEKPAREISASYSKIQRDRNALFHGDNEAPIRAEDVKEAIESFDWLAVNFKLGEISK